jgi:hypothetical protein
MIQPDPPSLKLWRGKPSPTDTDFNTTMLNRVTQSGEATAGNIGCSNLLCMVSLFNLRINNTQFKEKLLSCFNKKPILMS